MKRIRIVGLALLAVFAMGAIAATAAQAVEAPYWGVESKRLAAGETEEVTATQLSEYTLTAGALIITCKKSGVNPGGTINGSSGTEPGTSKESIKYEKCTVSGNGASCAVGHNGNEEIVTKPLKDELVNDATNGETKMVAVEFTPETGAILSNITLSGAGTICSPVSAGVLAVEGAVVGQALGGKLPTEFLLELGKAPVLAVSGAVKFPTTPIKSIILAGKTTTVSLSFAGKASKLIGETEIKLSSGKKWCIIS